MKKLILVIALLAVFPFAGARGLISFGPKVGANLNFASGSEMLKAGNVGYSFGVFMEVRPIKAIGISLDVMYSKEGFKMATEGGNVTYNLGYLNIPILANIYIWKGLALKAGIQPSIKLSGKVGFNGTQAPDGSTTDQFKDNIKKGNFAIPVGIGYSFKWGLTLDARYNIGVTSIYKDSQAHDFQSKVITISAGWKF